MQRARQQPSEYRNQRDVTFKIQRPAKVDATRGQATAEAPIHGHKAPSKTRICVLKCSVNFSEFTGTVSSINVTISAEALSHLSPTDQRCDSLRLKTLIRNPDPTDDRHMEPEQLARRLGEPAVRTKVRRAICRFPSEWDQRTVVERYSWLLTEDFKPEDDDATGAQKWERFVEHARAISFPNLPADFLKADWRFHPREFVGVMRTCGWLSAIELAQCVPRNAVEQTKDSGGNFVYPQYRDSLETDNSRATDSAGYYWITCAKTGTNAVCISRYADNYPAIQPGNLSNVCANYDYRNKTCNSTTQSINQSINQLFFFARVGAGRTRN